uniref:Osteoclast-stimulating factor 1 n=1 Tax=Oryzias melastigma TaxID=30732 RepID=A0A3B3CJ25_ORYME
MHHYVRHQPLNLIFCPICGCSAEVLVLLDFEGTASDELTVKTGDVLKNVTKASEEGWLYGELRGKRGIFPVNFVKEIPVYLIGDNKREPRSIRKPKKVKQVRQCEVTFAYTPQNEDELELVVGETIEIIREIEDGWWMGVKNGKVGAFPSNFVSEIFLPPKGKSRPKLSDAMFTKEVCAAQTPKPHCQVMFDYKAQSEDELDLKKGDVLVLLRKETEDEGWWEGELHGRCGFFPDNFVMVIPPVPNLQVSDQPPARNITHEHTGRTTQVNKCNYCVFTDEAKDLRSLHPTKVKLPYFNKPAPPPVKDKPNKILPKTNGDAPPVLPKPQEVKEPDQFDGMNVTSEKLSHPTANRAKPPQRRPPSGLGAAASVRSTSGLLLSWHPFACMLAETCMVSQSKKPLLTYSRVFLFIPIRRDMQEVKEELREERSKRLALQVGVSDFHIFPLTVSPGCKRP